MVDAVLVAGSPNHAALGIAIFYANWPKAERLYAEARDLLAGVADDGQQAWLSAFDATMRLGQPGDTGNALADCDAAAAAFERLDDACERACGLAYLATIFASRGDGERAVDVGSRAADLADELTAPTPATRFLIRMLTAASMELHLDDQALAYQRRGVELARTAGDPTSLSGQLHRLAGAHNEYGEQLRADGRPDLATQHHQEAEQLARAAISLGVAPEGEELLPSGTLAWALIGLERHREAIAMLTDIVYASRKVGNRWMEGTALLGLGRAHRRSGEVEAAETTLLAAVEILSDIKQMRFRQPALLELVGLHRDNGEAAKALPHLLAYLDAETTLRSDQRDRWLMLFEQRGAALRAAETNTSVGDVPLEWTPRTTAPPELAADGQ